MQHTAYRQRHKDHFLIDHMQMLMKMCAEEFHMLLQLRGLDLAGNRLSGTLPRSLAQLTQVSYAAYNVLHVQLPAVEAAIAKRLLHARLGKVAMHNAKCLLTPQAAC